MENTWIQNIKDLVNDFSNLCFKNEIWFSLDNLTLLGAARDGNFIPWSEKFEIFTTVEHFNRLKKEFPENIVDSSIDTDFNSFTAAWVVDRKQWKKNQPFIQIRVAVPSTVKNAKKFKSIFRSIRRKLTFKNDGIKLAINDLYDIKSFQGYALPFNRKSYSWIQVITEKVEFLNFLGLKLPVLVEYKEVLKRWFGENYLEQIPKPKKTYRYPAPLKMEEVA